MRIAIDASSLRMPDWADNKFYPGIIEARKNEYIVLLRKSTFTN
jgi:hypothetical protein